jgi:hypothetical protein
MAATNKCLVQNNKTRTRAKSTQKRAALQPTQRNRSQQMKTYGNLLLMTAICIVIFWIFMALRPAQAAGRIGMWLPPAQYDGLYTGELTIRRVATMQEIRDLCPSQNFNGLPATACTLRMRDASQCHIFVVSDKVLKAARVNYVSTLRHELGHCNGWPGDHKGGRLVPIDYQSAMPKLPASTKYLPPYPPTACVTPEWKPISCDERKLDDFARSPTTLTEVTVTQNLPWWVR